MIVIPTFNTQIQSKFGSQPAIAKTYSDRKFPYRPYGRESKSVCATCWSALTLAWTIAAAPEPPRLATTEITDVFWVSHTAEAHWHRSPFWIPNIMVCHPKFSCLDWLWPKPLRGKRTNLHLSLVNHEFFTYLFWQNPQVCCAKTTRLPRDTKPSWELNFRQHWYKLCLSSLPDPDSWSFRIIIHVVVEIWNAGSRWKFVLSHATIQKQFRTNRGKYTSSSKLGLTSTSIFGPY